MKTKSILILLSALAASTLSQQHFRIPSTSYGVPIDNPEEIKLLKSIFDTPADTSAPRLTTQYGVPAAVPKVVPQQVYAPPQEQRFVLQQPKYSYEQRDAAIPSPTSVDLPQTSYGVPQTTNYRVPERRVVDPQQTYEPTKFFVPQTTYRVPAQLERVVVPQQAYSAPQQRVVSPQPIYQRVVAPQSVYGVPQQNFVQPQISYDVPIQQTKQITYGSPQIRQEVPVQSQLTYRPPASIRRVVTPTKSYGLQPETEVVVPQQIYRVPQPQTIPTPAREYGLVGRAPINIVQRYTITRTASPPNNPSFELEEASLKPENPVRLSGAYAVPQEVYGVRNVVKELPSVPHTIYEPSNIDRPIVIPAREYGL